MYQTATTATLKLWIHVGTDETTMAYETVPGVQIRNTSDTILGSVTLMSNLNKGAQSLVVCNISAFTEQTILVYFAATEHTSLQTNFIIDDVSLPWQ